MTKGGHVSRLMVFPVQGEHISLANQIQQVTDTFQLFALNLGEVAAADLISRSIFYVSIGSNDFIHYYLRNEFNVQARYQPHEFNLVLATTVKREIQVISSFKITPLYLMPCLFVCHISPSVFTFYCFDYNNFLSLFSPNKFIRIEYFTPVILAEGYNVYNKEPFVFRLS